MDISLTDPVSTEQPCGPDLEYDPEYLLLFNRAAPQSEAQYGDFISTPETVNWSEIERDTRRLLARSKDLRVLILLLRCRTQLAGAQGMAETLALMEKLCATYSDTLHPQLPVGQEVSTENREDAMVARSNALAALLDHEGVMADIRSITLSNNAAIRLQVRDVERALSAPRPVDALAPESVRQQLADLEARGRLPLMAFRQSARSIESLQQWANDTLSGFAPDFSRLRHLLMLLPDMVQSTTSEVEPPQMQSAIPEATLITSPQGEIPPADTPVIIQTSASIAPESIRNRSDALERLRVIRRWFESNEPSSPTIPLLRQAERLVGKRFSEVINEIPPELLEKWDPPE
ncbi:ImpA family type VI secretion system protein [Pseudenterobacter timonensis]|uniref:ImpA family type VI secretion system protein n=1 Tax=Pseudenterobacter timonensis TaxID=1755099 RepID=A0ABV4A5N8_9ENTR